MYEARRVSGWLFLWPALLLIPVGGGVLLFGGLGVLAGFPGGIAVVGLGICCLVIVVSILSGLTIVRPQEAVLLQFFGQYRGSVSSPGYYMVRPFTAKKHISLGIRNFESRTLKVNDADGSPVEIGAMVTYRVVDTYRAWYNVENYPAYVETQAEAALRHLAAAYAYDAPMDSHASLRNSKHIAVQLAADLAARVGEAGLAIVETKITHLAYATEIAQAMLVRQQAAQMVAARRLIVDGAVGMVQTALDRLGDENIVALDSRERGRLVANLLVVICGDRAAQPMIGVSADIDSQ